MARRLKAGWKEKDRIEESPWLDWLDELTRVCERIQQAARDSGRSVVHLDLRSPPDSTDRPNPSLPRDWRDLGRLVTGFGLNFSFERGGDRIALMFHLVTRKNPGFTWTERSGEWGFEGKVLQRGTLSAKGVFEVTDDLTKEKVRFKSAAAFRKDFCAYLRRRADHAISAI